MSDAIHYAYDVFISYSSKDAAWVRGELLPRLERAGLTVVIDFRDFEIGVPSLINMERAVDRSRHTLVVLTPDWIASAWTEFESLLVGTRDPAGRQRKLIPLMVRKCEIPQRIAMLTYLDLSDVDVLDEQMPRLIKSLTPSVHRLDESGQSVEVEELSPSYPNEFVEVPAGRFKVASIVRDSMRRVIVIFILAGVTAGITSITGNVVSNTLPESWNPYLWLAWPLFITFTSISIGVGVWQARVQASDDRATGTRRKKNRGEISDKKVQAMTQEHKREYRVLGIPIWSISEYQEKREYRVLGVPIWLWFSQSPSLPATTTVAIILGLIIGSRLLATSNSSPDISIEPTPILPTMTVTIPQTSSSDILYEADWSQGLTEWNYLGSWKIEDGMLMHDGTEEGRVIIADYAPEGITDYAVEAEIQVSGGFENEQDFALIARAQQHEGSGFLGYSGVIKPGLVRIMGGGERIEQKPFEQARASLDQWHVYRLEVQGEAIRLFVDDKLIVQDTDSTYTKSGRVGLFSTETQLKVRSFRVRKLH